jgi:hypothetical protein
MQVKTAENRNMCNWVQSVLVFSQAHNLKVVGSNPTPATKIILFKSVTYRKWSPLREWPFFASAQIERQIEKFQLYFLRKKNYDLQVFLPRRFPQLI